MRTVLVMCLMIGGGMLSVAPIGGWRWMGPVLSCAGAALFGRWFEARP